MFPLHACSKFDTLLVIRLFQDDFTNIIIISEILKQRDFCYENVPNLFTVETRSANTCNIIVNGLLYSRVSRKCCKFLHVCVMNETKLNCPVAC